MTEKPMIDAPMSPAPSELVTTDLVDGEGSVANSGDKVTVHYVGVDYASGEQFDASWDRGQPLTFGLGTGQVIAGWDQGVQGMKVGGRRQLVIPPPLAYGKAGAPPVIAPDATLIFVVDLISVA